MGDGFTLSLDIVMIVPRVDAITFKVSSFYKERNREKYQGSPNKKLTIIENGYDQDHEGREVKPPDQSNKHKTKLQDWIGNDQIKEPVDE